MSALAKLFSEADVAKRRVKDFLRSPLAAMQMIGDQQRRQWDEDPQAQAMQFFNPEAALSPLAGVIKQKGGSWLSGSVEDALRGLKPPKVPNYAEYDLGPTGYPVARGFGTPMTEEGLARIYGPQGEESFRASRNALNSWIDKQLARYVKNDMATPEDPIRALAERGVLHFEPNLPPGTSSLTVGKRARLGQKPMGEGVSPRAQQWEGIADDAVFPNKIGDLTSSREPWMEGRDPTEVAYSMERGKDLGFNHLIDELSNALNPESGLPRELRFGRPEALGNESVPNAVERVAKINAWRAEQARLATIESMKANLAQKPYKEYEGGWRWAELPDADTPDGAKLVNEIGCQGGWCTQGESAARTYGSHKGGNRLYALIDHEGRPHIQVQTKAQEKPASLNPRILQIKPFSNSWDSQMVKDFTAKNPKYREELMPMIQDFVKSGKWSDVGDLQNTGLMTLSPKYNPDIVKAMEAAGETPPSYVTETELDELLKKYTPDGYAQGGSVRHNVYNRLLQALN